jgi:hypothetical protein
MRGTYLTRDEVPPHQLGRMTYSRATNEANAVGARDAAVSYGLAPSPQRGEVALGLAGAFSS